MSLGVLWMSMVEGGQCSMVGLPPIDRELYKESHPITYQITSLGHKGEGWHNWHHTFAHDYATAEMGALQQF